MLKKTLLALALPLLLLPIAFSCASGESGGDSVAAGQIDNDAVEENVIDDNYRTIYEIIPYSFSDSDGDDIGDLTGIQEKLDYIEGLNYDGIWCTPIVQSPNYHKYDATDFYAVDEDFGTLDDFDALIEDLHERGMVYIFDLAINHTSNEHEWFTTGAYEFVYGSESDADYKYANYYNFLTIESGGSLPTGYEYLSGYSNLAYECRFWSGMPDLNLQAVLDDEDGELATEIKNIIDFWLIEHDVDGFRLDAVTSYFSGDLDKNTEFLTWLNDYVKSQKEDAYIVGEGSWDNYSENSQYFSSGTDSFFDFANHESTGPIAMAIKREEADDLASGMERSTSYAEPGIAANFVANHDVGRMVGVVSGRSDSGALKLGHLLLALQPGCVFNYYGDEIGMAVTNSDSDPNKRLHMDWGDDDSHVCEDPPDTLSYADETGYPYPSVSEQEDDEDSVLSYVAKANSVRRLFPEIARGSAENADLYYLTDEDGEEYLGVAVIKKTYEDGEGNESSVYLALNLLSGEDVEYDFSALGDVEPVWELAASGNSTYEGTTLHIKSRGLVVLR